MAKGLWPALSSHLITLIYLETWGVESKATDLSRDLIMLLEAAFYSIYKVFSTLPAEIRLIETFK